MNFTSKEEYGLMAVMRLAMSAEGETVQAREIARIEGIPEQFLEQVLAALRRAGIVRSIRGASGGYVLARPARDITAGDVVRALGGKAVPSLSKPEGNPNAAVVSDLQDRTQSAVWDILDGTAISEMVEKSMNRVRGMYLMMNI